MDPSKTFQEHLEGILAQRIGEPFGAARSLAECIALVQVHLPAWIRFPNDPRQWTAHQRSQRCWPPEFWALISAGPGEGAYRVSCVRGQEDIGEWILRTMHPNTSDTPPPEMPEPVRTSLENGWRVRRAYGAPASFIYVRNEWAERRILVSPIVERAKPLFDLAGEALRRLGKDSSPVADLANDTHLHADSLGTAIDCLRDVVPDMDALRTAVLKSHRTAPNEGGGGQPSSTANGPATIDPDRLVTVDEAANVLGVPLRTVSNWISREYDRLQHVDKLGGPRSVARRYRLKDIAARRPRDRT